MKSVDDVLYPQPLSHGLVHLYIYANDITA
jgi:hypothetical protein